MSCTPVWDYPFFLATRLLIHAQCVSKIICKFLFVGLVLTLQHPCSIDAVDVLIQRKKFCTYFCGVQSSVMNMLFFFFLISFLGNAFSNAFHSFWFSFLGRWNNIRILSIVPHENINLKRQEYTLLYIDIPILIYYHPLTNMYEPFH